MTAVVLFLFIDLSALFFSRPFGILLSDLLLVAWLLVQYIFWTYILCIHKFILLEVCYWDCEFWNFFNYNKKMKFSENEHLKIRSKWEINAFFTSFWKCQKSFVISRFFPRINVHFSLHLNPKLNLIIIGKKSLHFSRTTLGNCSTCLIERVIVIPLPMCNVHSRYGFSNIPIFVIN